MPRFTPAPSPRCPRCNDLIYATELTHGPNSIPYHIRCLTCSVCNKRLDSSLLVEHEGKPYCKHCHAKMFGTGANGFSRAVPLQARTPEAAGVRVGAFASPSSPTTATIGASGGSAAAAVTGAPTAFATRGYAVSPSTHRATSSVSSIASSSSRLASTIGGSSVTVGGIASSPAQAQPIRPRERLDSTSSASSAAKHGSVSAFPFARGSTNPNPARITTDQQFEDEFGPPPVPGPVSRTLKQEPAQSMDDLVNQVTGITIRPRGVGVVPAPDPDTQDPQREEASTATPDDAQSDLSAVSTTATIGAVPAPTNTGAAASGSSGGLPPPKRLTPSNAASSYKTAPAYGGGTSGVTRLGLGSSISAAAGGTPLCARCDKPVYFAEKKQGAGRLWHRACLRCDGCSTILESGRLEEGPANAAEVAAQINPQGGRPANVWCRICYAKHFGPKGLGVGLSVPDAISRP
ncbi:hypothetical protein OC861_003297 [Tilletia horrida]|nr:hypothetical protein OC861_003297 [Tilletia horrida]